MGVRMVPTLETMAGIYRLPRTGGARSERFVRYVELCRSIRPLAAYNPMTGKEEALRTVEALLEVEAERLVGEAFVDSGLGGDDIELAVVVLTPGAWTDRLFTDVRNRRDGIGAVWFWSDEPVDRAAVVAAARAEAVRVAWRAAHGPAESLWELASQEGLARRMAVPGLVAVDVDCHERVREVLDVVGTEVDDHTLIAFVFGDERVEPYGWRGLGLSGDTGIRVCSERAPAPVDIPAAIREGWCPF
jgi:hypothetical protein